MLEDSKYRVQWYAQFEGKDKFYLQQSTDDIELTEEHIVHHFPKLTGTSVTSGHLLKKDLAAIQRALLAGEDAVANGGCGCAACGGDDRGSPFLRCDMCSAWYHVRCATAVGDPGDAWWCEKCNRDA